MPTTGLSLATRQGIFVIRLSITTVMVAMQTGMVNQDTPLKNLVRTRLREIIISAKKS
jgi:hypothetical protein